MNSDYNLNYCIICDILIIDNYIYIHCNTCNKCHINTKLIYCNHCNNCYNPYSENDIIIHIKKCIFYSKFKQ